MHDAEPVIEWHQRWHADAGARREGVEPEAPRSGTHLGQPDGGSGYRAPLIAATAIATGFAVAAYGIAESRDLLAAIGLCAIGVIGLTMAAATRAQVRRLERHCKMLGRARAESERARHDLRVENADLERRIAELEAERAAIVDGLEWVDEQTAGRLRTLLDAAGIELAELTDMVLDDEGDDP